MTIYFTPSICQILEIHNLYGRNSPKEEICVSISPKRETEATKTRTLCPQQLDAETVVLPANISTVPEARSVSRMLRGQHNPSSQNHPRSSP